MTRFAIKPARSCHRVGALKSLSYPGRLASIAAVAIVAMTLAVGCSSDSVTGPTPMPEPEAEAEVQPQATPVLEPLPLPVTPLGQADLIVSIINFSPGAPKAGDEITFWVFVKNIGNASATASSLRFRVGGESQPPVVAVPELAPDAEYRYTRKVTLNVAQSYQATGWADDLDQVAESDESNNTTARVFTVAP
jgi:subtilase family serine protease